MKNKIKWGLILVGLVAGISVGLYILPRFLGFLIHATSLVKYQRGEFISKQQNPGPWEQIQDSDIRWDNNISAYNPRGGKGVKLDYINNIVADKTGRLWIPTDGSGLFMFDGVHWNHWWHGDDQQSYQDMDALRGIATVDNQVYAISSGSVSGDIFHYNLDRMIWDIPWHYAPFNTDEANIYSIGADSRGRLHFVTSDGKLVLYDRGRVQIQPMKCIGNLFPQPMFLDAQDNLWVINAFRLGNNGPDDKNPLCKMTGGVWREYISGPAGIKFVDITSIESDAQGRILFSAGSNLILVDQYDRWYSLSLDQISLGGESIVDIAIDPSQRIWFLTENKLVIHNGRSAQSIDLAQEGVKLNATAGIATNTMAFDKDGHLWIGTQFQGSIFIFRGQVDLEPADAISELIQQATPLEVLITELP